MSDTQLYGADGMPTGYCFYAEVKVFGGDYRRFVRYTNVYPKILVERYTPMARKFSVVRYDGTRAVWVLEVNR